MSSFADVKQQRQSRQGLRFAPPRAKEYSSDNQQQSLAQRSPTSQAEVSSPAETSRPFTLKENSDLQVRESQQKGRGVFWQTADQTTKCKRGTLLLRLSPSTSVLSSSLLASRCSYCFQAAPSLLRCSACKQVRYCNITCQQGDWNQHKEECKCIKAFAQLQAEAHTKRRKEKEQEGKRRAGETDTDDSDEEQSKIADPLMTEPGTSVRAMARLIWAQKRGCDKLRTAVDDLQSHRAIMDQDALQPAGQIAMRLAKYLAAPKIASSTGEEATEKKALSELGFRSAAELVDFVCKFASNSFALTDSDLSNLGVCLDPTTALVNHSCWPNAAIVFPFGGKQQSNKDQGTMQLVAIRDLEPGEEVLISYIDIADRYEDRQKTLKERYFFECACSSVCARTVKVMNAAVDSIPKRKWRDPREAMWCPTKCGGWVSRPAGQQPSGTAIGVCHKCKKQATLDLSSLKHDIEEGTCALKEAEQHLSINDPVSAWRCCSRVLLDLVDRYPPSSQPLFDLLRVAQTALIELGSAGLPPGEGQMSDSRQVISPLDLDRDATSYYFEEATRLGMLLIAGCQASTIGSAAEGGSIYPEGHPARAIAIATLAKLILVELQQPSLRGDAQSGRMVSTSSKLPSMLKNPPSILPGARLLFAKQVLTQALHQLEIGFGRSNQGGETGKDVRKALEELEREAVVLAQAGVQ